MISNGDHIKMKQGKNVFGRRVDVDEVLKVGSAIPLWQAEVFVKWGVAEKHIAVKKPKKATKKTKKASDTQ